MSDSQQTGGEQAQGRATSCQGGSDVPASTVQPEVSPSASNKEANIADASKVPDHPGRQRLRRNKKKELTGGLKECEEVLNELFSKQYSSFAYVFYDPVKGPRDYHDIIKQPMDMKTVKRKLNDRQYSSVSGFKKDIMLMINNCKTYNDDPDPIIEMAVQFETLFLARMADIEACFSQDEEVGTPAEDANPKLKANLHGNETYNCDIPPLVPSDEDSDDELHPEDSEKVRGKKTEESEEDSEKPPEKVAKKKNTATVKTKNAAQAAEIEEDSEKPVEKVVKKKNTATEKTKNADKKGDSEKPPKKAATEKTCAAKLEADSSTPPAKDKFVSEVGDTTGTSGTAAIDKNIDGKCPEKVVLGSYEELMSEANELFCKKDYGGAISKFKDASSKTEDKTNLAKCYSNSAHCYNKKENFEEGALNAMKAMELKPTFFRGFLRCAEAYSLSGEKSKAALILLKGIAINPKSMEIINRFNQLKESHKDDVESAKGYIDHNFNGNAAELDVKCVSNLNRNLINEKTKQKLNKNGKKVNKSEPKPCNKAAEDQKNSNSSLDASQLLEIESIMTEVKRTSKINPNKSVVLLTKKETKIGKVASDEKANQIQISEGGGQESSQELVTHNSVMDEDFNEDWISKRKRGAIVLNDTEETLNRPTHAIRKYEDTYPFTDVSEVFDTKNLEVVLSSDKKRSIESRIEEAIAMYDVQLQKVSSGKELKYLEFQKQTMGVDPLVILAGFDTATSFKLNGAVTVVERGNGHISPAIEWNIVIGKKGINKTGGFNLTLKQLQEMENEDVHYYHKLFEEHVREMLLEAEEAESPSEPSSESPGTPLKQRGSPKKKKSLPVFNEMSYRNLMQSGTAEGILDHMFNAVDKNFFMYFDEASTLFGQLYTSGGPGTCKRTQFLTKLLSFFSAGEARDSKVTKGSQIISEASIQIYAVAQPSIFLDFFRKDGRDPAGVIDRMSFWTLRPVTVSLRQQKENLRKLERQDLDIKKLFRTIEFIANSTPNEWIFDEEAEEAIFQLDENMTETEKNADDPEGVLMAMFAKAREKIYRGAAREAVKRNAYGMMKDDIELKESVKVENIIIKTDVLKAAALVHMSCYIFRQYKAAVDELDPERTHQIDAKKAEENKTERAADNVTKSFVSNLDHWKKDIKEYPLTWVKVKAVYDSERDEMEEDMIHFETLKNNGAYVRASSKKKFNKQQELLFFLRCLEFNELGKVFFGKVPDEQESNIFDRNTYAKIRFQPIPEEDDLSDSAKEIMEHIAENFEDFHPFK